MGLNGQDGGSGEMYDQVPRDISRNRPCNRHYSLREVKEIIRIAYDFGKEDAGKDICRSKSDNLAKRVFSQIKLK